MSMKGFVPQDCEAWCSRMQVCRHRKQDSHQGIDVAVGTAYIHSVSVCYGRGKYGPNRHHLLHAGNHVVVEKVKEGRFVIWSAVGLSVGRAVFLGILSFKAPLPEIAHARMGEVRITPKPFAWSINAAKREGSGKLRWKFSSRYSSWTL
jgi:hypothetical protein